MKEIERRRAAASATFAKLQGLLGDAEVLLADDACVYATGSFGREEASEYSDLDLFIVGRSPRREDGTYENVSQLSHLNEICIKADLIEATRELNIPDFDGDGKYLTHHPVRDLTATLGTPEEDANNTFTARLLMLLESRPLLGSSAYLDPINEIVAAYWRDFKDHKRDFVPAFLADDILRLWRTFCVNYEARTEREPDEKKARGKLKNYKLKHSRLLTCYSALLYVLVIYQRNQTVGPNDVVDMIGKTPLYRLRWLLEQPDIKQAHDPVLRLLERYNLFLERTNEPEANLILKFMDPKMTKSLFGDARAFGETMFDALNSIGNGSRFHRILLV